MENILELTPQQIRDIQERVRSAFSKPSTSSELVIDWIDDSIQYQ